MTLLDFNVKNVTLQKDAYIVWVDRLNLFAVWKTAKKVPFEIHNNVLFANEVPVYLRCYARQSCPKTKTLLIIQILL
jgi:hypothetical protein